MKEPQAQGLNLKWDSPFALWAKADEMLETATEIP
jgi:hypothetical protein